MLKHYHQTARHLFFFQPPSGGCVLKLGCLPACPYRHGQPPSGGCVLKLWTRQAKLPKNIPAAFGRLCVETNNYPDFRVKIFQPPSGGCVLKLKC